MLGDSHAKAMLNSLGTAFKENGISGWFVRNEDCEPIIGIFNVLKATAHKVRRCADSQEAFLEFVQSSKSRAIVIVMRWTYRLYPIEGEIGELTFDNGEGGRESDTHREYAAIDSSGRLSTGAGAKAAAVKAYIEKLSSFGVPTVIQYPIPEVGWNTPNLNFKHIIAVGEVPSLISTSWKRFTERNAFVTGILDSINSPQNLIRIRPSDILCNTYLPDRCVSQVGGIPLYFDDDHLSDQGAKLVVAGIMKQLLSRLPKMAGKPLHVKHGEHSRKLP